MEKPVVFVGILSGYLSTFAPCHLDCFQNSEGGGKYLLRGVNRGVAVEKKNDIQS